MDPARTFKESLTSRPELENSQGHSLTSSSAATSSALPSGPDIADARRSGVGGIDSPPLLHNSLHTNCCKKMISTF